VDFYGTKIKGKPVYPPAISEQRRKAWDKVKEGGRFKSSLTVPRGSKSQSQLGAIWGLMMTQACAELDDRGYDTSFIYNLPDPTGIAIDQETLCGYLYEACPIRNEMGHKITLSKADTIQAAKFFEDVRAFLASQWSIVIPDPNPNWKGESCH